MPPSRKRPPRRATTPAMPDGHFNNPRPQRDTTCMFDQCEMPGVLYAGGTRCPKHRPNYEKYLAAWLAGFHKGEPT